MAFSLSPSVDVREFDLTLSVPNLPSSKTGMVIRTDKGESLKIQSITSERDLVAAFGEPTAYNYQDWYNAWNFLQYASSLYMVRAMDDDVENAGMEITSNSGVLTVEQLTQENLFNHDKAELTLETEVTPEGIRFYNKNIKSEQKYAVAICMSESEWEKPFSAEGSDLLHVLTTTASLDTSSDSGSSTVDFSSNTMIVGDTFEFDGNTYSVDAVDNIANTVTVSPALVDADDDPISGLHTFTSNMVPEVIAYREETFSSDLVNADGSLVSFNKFFEYPPEFNKGEFAILVLEKDEDGKYDNIEEYVVSKKENGRDSEGRNIFVDEVFFKSSDALYAKYNVDYTEDINTSEAPLVKLEGTTVTDQANEPKWLYPRKVQYLADGTTFDQWIYDPIGYKQADVMTAFDEFADPESFDINLLVSHQLDMNRASTIAATRKDCLAIVAPYDYASIVGKSATDASAWLIEEFGSQTSPVAGTFGTFNSYSAIYGNMKYQYDKFNDVNRWLCIAGDIAGLAAQTDANRDPWWAFAGLERGKIRNSIKPAFNPNKQNRDDLYVNSINPVMSVPGEGVMIVWGQKTSFAKPSAFDRVNVRRLLITVEKAIATASRYALFEFNDEFTRARLRGLIEPFLRDVKGRRGIYDFLVVIDSSNNTAEVIDKNALIIDVYIKPTKVAEFIQINMNVTRTDANFEELIAR
jgi:hypothetical protein